MARLVFATAGAAVGFMVGGPAGAQAGWVIGGAIGGTFEPNKKTEGPRLGDLSVTGSTYGATIPWVAGTPRVAGQIIWASPKREIATTTSQGKGGGGGQDYTSYTYEVDVLFLVSSNQIAGISRIWSNGKLVFNGLGSIETLMASGGTDKWARVTSYGGGPSQLPDPTYEAAVGTANACAYRGRGTVFIQSLQLGSSGAMPNLTFEIANSQTGTVMCLQHFEQGGYTTYRGVLPWNSNYNMWLISQVPAAVGPKWNMELYGQGNGSIEYYYNNESGVKTPGSYGEASFLNAQRLNIVTAAAKTGYQYANAYLTLDSSFDVGAGEDWTIEIVHDPIDGNGLYNAGIYNTAETAFVARFGDSTDGGWDLNNIYSVGVGGRAYSFFSYPIGGGLNGGFCPMNKKVRVCVTKSGNTLRMYYDGVLTASATTRGACYWKGKKELVLGAQSIQGGTVAVTGGGEGKYDEILLIKGLAICTGSSYTPATGQYADASTITIASRTPPTLQTVVNNLCTLAGLSAGQYDTSALAAVTTPVRALAISQVSSVRAVLEILSKAYNFEATISDKIYFRLRGTAPVAVIPYADLGCDGAEPLVIRTQNDLEVPSQIALTYANMDNDHQPGTEYSDRLLTGQTNTQTMQMPLSFVASEAKVIADTMLTDKAVSARSTALTLPVKYAALEPTDVVTVQDQDSSTWRLRVVKRTDADGQIRLETVMDDPSVFTQAGTTSAGSQGQSVVSAPAATSLMLLDTPLMQDSEDTPGHYFALAGKSSGWTNGSLYHSFSDGNYTLSQTVTDSAVFGTTESVLANYSGPLAWDEVSSVQVGVGTGQLSSSTNSAILMSRSLNAALIGSEVVQFRTATLIAPGVYNLSGFLRGLRGTEWARSTHILGENFCLLTSGTGIGFQPLSSGDLGKVGYYKGVGLGQRVSSVVSKTMTPVGINLKPFAPTDLRTNRVAADTVFTWKRRTRLATRFTGSLGINVPLGESVESYDFEVYADLSFSTLKRTFAGLTTPTCTYTSAQQITDFGSNQIDFFVKVYQNSATVGRGYALTSSEYKPYDPDVRWTPFQAPPNTLAYTVGDGRLVYMSWNNTGFNIPYAKSTGQSTGKRYFEATYTTSPAGVIGVGLANAAANPGASGGMLSWGGQSIGTISSFVQVNGAFYINPGSWGVGDKIGMAIDFSTGQCWITKNGVAFWGNPAAGTGGVSVFTPNTLVHPVVWIQGAGNGSARIFSQPNLVTYPISGFTGFFI